MSKSVLRAVPATLMLGGTSKGLYVDVRDLPVERGPRDRFLLAAMGSPDFRQIDGVGGAHPLTSKVARLGPATRPDADVDYLFLQVAVDEAEVSDSQTCGNILAGVGPWAIENGYVAAGVPTPNGGVDYEGDARIDGVDVTCIDNGMPVVILDAADFAITGGEAPEVLEANGALKARVEKIRLTLGPRMKLGDVATKTVPKMMLVSAARHGGALDTRTFIPHRVHEAIGVLGAVSVATACLVPATVAARIAADTESGGVRRLDIEHPTGLFTVEIELASDADGIRVSRSALLRTARKLMRGEVFVPAAAWASR